MTPVTPHTTILRDQMVSALREAYPEALSTNQIAELMPPIVCQRSCRVSGGVGPMPAFVKVSRSSNVTWTAGI